MPAVTVVRYKVEVHTGKKSSAGTDANVYINMFGDLGDTGKRYLRYSKTNKNKFEKGQVRSWGVFLVLVVMVSDKTTDDDGEVLAGVSKGKIKSSDGRSLS